MANIGLTNLWWATLTEAVDGTATYDGAKYLGKAVSCSVEVTNNTAKLYGDDAVAESDTTFANGKITCGVTDDDDTVFAPLLGHTMALDGEVVKTASDTAPYVGIGRVVTKMVNGAYKYKAEFLSKVKFGEPSKDEKTKGESVEFSTPSIVGDVMALGDAHGTWNRSKTFDTKSDALAFIKNILNSGVTTSYTITYDVNGGSGTVASQTVTAGESVTLNDGTGVTAPTNKTFKGWGTTADATTVLTSPYTPNANVTLYAVYENAE